MADPSENDPTMIAPLLGFAKQGSAEGKLLYVNYGTSEDFQALKSNFSVTNCNGYIAIMRYGKIHRGDKVGNKAIHLGPGYTSHLVSSNAIQTIDNEMIMRLIIV